MHAARLVDCLFVCLFTGVVRYNIPYRWLCWSLLRARPAATVVSALSDGRSVVGGVVVGMATGFFVLFARSEVGALAAVITHCEAAQRRAAAMPCHAAVLRVVLRHWRAALRCTALR